MDLSENICFCCCSVQTKAMITRLSLEQVRFLRTLLGQHFKSRVRACRSCQDRVEGFRQFCGQIQENMKMLGKIQDEHEHVEDDVEDDAEPDSTCTVRDSK